MSNEHPNANLARQLRAVADWLDEHPELPRVYRADLGHVAIGPNARNDLEMFARAMPNPVERATRDYARITTTAFAPVEVGASARMQDLAPDTPPTPAYEPILGSEVAR